jgi:hypothetical protein
MLQWRNNSPGYFNNSSSYEIITSSYGNITLSYDTFILHTKKAKRCFHLRQAPCSSGIKGEGKKLPTLHLINPVRVDVNIRHTHGKNVCSISIHTRTGWEDQLPGNPWKVKAKKPCLHLLYPMNKTFAEGESNKKGFYYVGKKTFLHRLTLY